MSMERRLWTDRRANELKTLNTLPYKIVELDRGSNFIEYVRRCKKAHGEETHSTTHAARGNSTLCGKELGSMWYVLSRWGRTLDDINCRKCRRALRDNMKEKNDN